MKNINIIDLLLIEFLKLKNRQYIILAAILVLSAFGVNYIVYKVLEHLPMTQAMVEQVISPSWHYVAFFNSFILMGPPAMIIIMHTCAEYTYRTHRQNIIDGLTRQQYVTTKIMLVVAIALATTILVFLSAFLLGLFANTAFSVEYLKYVFYFFVQALMYLGLAFLIALILRRSILALSIFIVYALIIENILENKLKAIGDLLPLAVSDHLIPFPVKDADKIFTSNYSEPVYLIITIVYIAACYALCYYKYEKQDL